MDCFLNFPANIVGNPLDLEWIQRLQFEDERLQQRRHEFPALFPVKYIDNIPLLCYRIDPHLPQNEWRICIPTAALQDTIQWFHLILGHRGKTQVYDTIRRLYYHPNLKAATTQYECGTCQSSKLQGAQYGQLPPREAIMTPWEEVHVDLIGLWRLKIGERMVEFSALTCIDPVTNLVELIRVDNKSSAHVA